MITKTHKTFEEQVEILTDRGCYIDDKEFALQVLSHINYYRFSSYFLPFKECDNSDDYI